MLRVVYMIFSSGADFIFRGAESRPKGIRFTPTRNCTLFPNIGFVVAGGGFYSYYIHQGNKSDKERSFFKENSQILCIQKDLIHFLKDGCNYLWVQFHAYWEFR